MENNEQSYFDKDLIEEQQEAYQVLQMQKQQREEREAAEERRLEQEALADQKKAEGINDFGDGVKEVTGSVVGGVVKAASDVITTPERVVDLFSGQVDKNYEPDWNPLKGATDYFKPRTWWGGMLQDATSFATAFIPIAGQVGKVGKLSTIGGKTGTVVRGAVAGGVTDLLREDTYTDQSLTAKAFKAGGVVIDNNALTRTFINVVEGMGMGVIADYALAKIFGKAGLDTVSQKIEARNADVAEQTLERGKQQLKEPGFGGYKNKPIADQQQGNVNSKAKPSEVLEQLNEIKNDPKAKDGSTDSFLTEAQIARASKSSGQSAEVFIEATKDVVSDVKMQEMLAGLKSNDPAERANANKIMKESLERLGTDLNGRVRRLTLDEIQETIDSLVKAPKIVDESTGLSRFTPANVITADLLLGSLSKISRDLGIAGREVVDEVDVLDKDGILSRIFDMQEVLLVEAKKARRNDALNLLSYRSDTVLPTDVDSIKAEVRESMDFLRQVAKDDKTGNLTQAILEVNSMGGKIANYEDLDAWARKTMQGYNNGQRKTPGMMTRELTSMTVHSLLSSPKTPMRALNGTTMNTYNRQMALLIGGLARVGVGDTQTSKIALAELTGMARSLPEAWKVFKKRLGSHWSNDPMTLRTRYIEYEKRQAEWDAYSAWVQERGSIGEKAAYNFLNVVRGINNSNFFTYGSKIMAATDETFQVIFARGRASGKAMEESLTNNGGRMSKEALAEYEDRYFAKLLKPDGTINFDSDLYLKSTYEEATLTAKLEGPNKTFEKLLDDVPVLKPFFLFARTGVNGLAMTAKNTPLLNIALTKQRRILWLMLVTFQKSNSMVLKLLKT